MILYEQGKNYWEIARRYHSNRNNPAIRPVAVRDMQRLRQDTRHPGVLKRINNFIARHSPPSPQGPRLA